MHVKNEQLKYENDLHRRRAIYLMQNRIYLNYPPDDELPKMGKNMGLIPEEEEENVGAMLTAAQSQEQHGDIEMGDEQEAYGYPSPPPEREWGSGSPQLPQFPALIPTNRRQSVPPTNPNPLTPTRSRHHSVEVDSQLEKANRRRAREWKEELEERLWIAKQNEVKVKLENVEEMVE